MTTLNVFAILYFLYSLATVAVAGTCIPFGMGSCSAQDNGNGCQLVSGYCDVTADANCQRINNLSGKTFFVPVKETSGNWGAFITYLPPGVTKEACGAAPTGCTFNGSPVANGGSVTAYLNATEPTGGTCTSQTRTCTSGTLSGTYANSSCTVTAATNCTFNGSPVANGGSVTAYLNATEPVGGTCTSQVRTCNSGTLSGTYANSGCTVTSATNCTFNGSPVNNGASVTAYLNATEPFGGTCTSQARTCTNGTLSGTYGNASCSVGAGADCSDAVPLTWSGNVSGCDALIIGSRSHGTVITANEGDGGRYGNATFTCNNATWTVGGTPVCEFNSCIGSQLKSWDVGGVTCNGTSADTPHGTSVTVTSTTNTGSASFACSAGTWSTTPNATPTPTCTVAGCPAVNPQVWGTNCSANLAAAANGDPATSLTNLASGYTGSANFTCSAGSWTLQSGSTCEPSGPGQCMREQFLWYTNTGCSPANNPSETVAQPLITVPDKATCLAYCSTSATCTSPAGGGSRKNYGLCYFSQP